MGLKDRPLVDTSAEHASLSLNELRRYFQEINGFIAREDHPDKGCDLLVELIDDGKATNWRFPVQVKSILEPKVVGGGAFITYPFELSRLGYLLEYKPLVGLVIFYAVKEKKFYYEYVEQIYFRLKDQHPSDDWKDQEKANIHIPVENVLTLECTKELHQKMAVIFSRHNNMYRQNAINYNLPSVEHEQRGESAKPLAERAEYTLRMQGMQLYQQRRISFLYKLLCAVSNHTVINDSEIMVIAGMTYHEMGLYVDAEYYLSKAINKKDLNSFARQSAEWTKAKNDFRLSKIDLDTFITRAIEQFSSIDVDDKPNRLLHEINIMRYKILGKTITDPLPAGVDKRTHEIHQELEQLDIPQHFKGYLQLMNADNFNLYIQRFQDHVVIKEGQTPVSWDEMLNSRKYIITAQAHFRGVVDGLILMADKNQDKILQAEAMSVLAKSSLMLNLGRIRADVGLPSDLTEQESHLLIQDFNYAIYAGNLYLKEHLFNNAYFSFCCALELLWIAKHHDPKIEYNEHELKSNMTKLEERLDLPAYELQSLAHYERLKF